MADCYKIYEETIKKRIGEPLTEYDTQRLERSLNAEDAKLKARGETMETVDPETGETNFDKWWKEYNDERIRGLIKTFDQDTASTIRSIQLMDDMEVRANNLKQFYPKKSMVKLRAEALQNLFWNTNYLYMGNISSELPLEKIVQLKIGELFAGWGKEIEVVLRDANIDLNDLPRRLEADPELRNDFMKEYWNLANNFESAKNRSITQNDVAHKLAKTFMHETSHKWAKKMTMAGVDPKSLQGSRIKVMWKNDIMKKYKDPAKWDEFADIVGPELHHIHGDLTQRKALAKDLIQVYHENGGDWRAVDRHVSDLTKSDLNYRQNLKSGKEMPYVVRYKSADAFSKINRQFNPNSTQVSNLLLNTIVENARELALVQHGGPDYHNTYRKLFRDIQQNDQLGKDFKNVNSVSQVQLKAVKGYVDQVVDPSINEKTGAASWMATFRSYQAASALGSAVITSVLDTGTMAFAGTRMFGLPVNDVIGMIFRTKSFKGNKLDTANFNNFVLDFTQGWLNKSGERFGLIDGIETGGRVQRWGSKFATNIFRWSGLNWWTESGRSAVASGYAGYFGRLIKSRISWENLKKESPRFWAQMQRYGIGESHWKNIIKHQPLDADGRFNLHLVDIEKFDPHLKDVIIPGQSSTRDRLVSMVSEAINTMVIHPDQIDRHAGKFFLDGHSKMLGGIGGIMTQFKTHPITYTRKVVNRQFNRQLLQQAGVDVNHLNYVADIAFITATMMSLGALVVQLKQTTQGKEMYKWNDEELWARTATTAGVWGLYSDFTMQIGGEDLIRGIGSDRKEPMHSSKDFWENIIGPVVVDAYAALQNIVFDPLTGGARWAKGIDNGEYLRRSLSKTTKMFGSATGLKNLWFSKMLYRKYFTEYLTELLDYRGYRAAERRIVDEQINDLSTSPPWTVGRDIYENLPGDW